MLFHDDVPTAARFDRDYDNSERCALAQHRHGEHAPPAQGDHARIVVRIKTRVLDADDVTTLPW